jgi:hypothetical protein
MRIRKPAKHEKPKNAPKAKSSAALPTGMRWTGTTALAPANLLQLQKSAGNRAVIELLKQHADPISGSLVSLKTYQAARSDGVEPIRGVDAKTERMALSQNPHLGDWQFRYVTGKGGEGVLYWVTLSNYKDRQRHILFDANSHTPLEVMGADLDVSDRKLLTEWATQLLSEQLSGVRSSIRPATKGASAQEEDESLLDSLFAGMGGDEDQGGSGLGALSAIIAAASSSGDSKGKTKPTTGKKR